MKRVVSLAVVAMLVGGAVWGYFYTQSRGSVPKFRLAKVERGPLTAAVSATGNLNAGQASTVRVRIDAPGQYPYPCLYHLSSGMLGTLEII